MNTIYRTYILPFTDLKRTLTLFGGFFGVLGFFLINNLSAYAFAADGYSGVISYFFPALIITGLIYWPCLYAGFSAYDGLIWRGGICIVQLTSLLIYISTAQTPLIQGILAGIIIAPFWCVFHVAMSQNTSHENRGFEVVTASFLNTLGCLIASFLIARYLTNNTPTIAAIIAMCSLMGGTIALLYASKIVRQHKLKEFIKEAKSIATQNPFMIRRIIAEGVYDMPKFTFGAFMFVMGHSALNMGLVLAGQTIVMAFLSPVIGKVAHNHRKHGYSIGVLILGLSWAIIPLAPDYLATYFLSLTLYSIGASFTDSSLMTGIYGMQKYASIMWTEFYLGISRTIGLLLIVPILYIDAMLYPFVLMTFSLALYFMNKRWQARWADGNIM